MPTFEQKVDEIASFFSRHEHLGHYQPLAEENLLRRAMKESPLPSPADIEVSVLTAAFNRQLAEVMALSERLNRVKRGGG